MPSSDSSAAPRGDSNSPVVPDIHGGREVEAGQSMVWLCGGALALCLLMIAGILLLLAVNGLGYFWQRPILHVELEDGRKLYGEVHDREPVAADSRVGGEVGSEAAGATAMRIRLKTGNRDLTGTDFIWIDETDIREQAHLADAVVLERLEWGNFYGRMVELRRGEEVLARGSERVWEEFIPLHADKRQELNAIHDLERGAIGDVNHVIEDLRLAQRRLGLRTGIDPEERRRREGQLAEKLATAEAEYDVLANKLFALRDALVAETLVMEAADGNRKEMPVGEVVRAIRPNSLETSEASRLYASRLWEFVADQPRESNTEGGIFPAIFGTVMMVFLMSFAVVPFGVLAALYLREYAKEGFLVSVVRTAVNNLAGVPSIVFGVFGLGFFVYFIGGGLDKLFYAEALPTPTYGTGGILWASLTLALLTVPVVIVATEEGLAAVPRIVREGSLALGATKFETTWRVVLPAAAPAILTGVILSMARAAGEVAPLMIVGMVKLAPTLPIDHHFPFVHLERKFMHLGFHIYDVGFQSPNVEAAKPLVFATAFLLVLVVTAMNLLAFAVRNHLRRKYATSVI